MRPVYKLAQPRPSKLNPYKQQINVWLEEAAYSAMRILEKLQEQGFEGKYSIVKEYGFRSYLPFTSDRKMECTGHHGVAAGV